jgi:hypothetical protein
VSKITHSGKKPNPLKYFYPNKKKYGKSTCAFYPSKACFAIAISNVHFPGTVSFAKKVIYFANVSRVFKSIENKSRIKHIHYPHKLLDFNTDETCQSSPTNRACGFVRGSGSRQDNLTLLGVCYTPFPYAKKIKQNYYY